MPRASECAAVARSSAPLQVRIRRRQSLAHRGCRDRDPRRACPLPSRRPRNLIPIKYRTTRPTRLSSTIRTTRKSRFSCQILLSLVNFSLKMDSFLHGARRRRGPTPSVGRASAEQAKAVAAGSRPTLLEARRDDLEPSEPRPRLAPDGDVAPLAVPRLTSCRRPSAWSDIVPLLRPISSARSPSGRDPGRLSREMMFQVRHRARIRQHGFHPMASSPRISRASRLRFAGSMSSGTACPVVR